MLIASSVSKSIIFFDVLVESTGRQLNPVLVKYVDTVFDNANTNYAEVCSLACYKEVTQEP
jgi:hypothetical protein